MRNGGVFFDGGGASPAIAGQGITSGVRGAK